MAIPTLNSRPEKTVNTVVSRWNAAALPIQYVINNTKWPTNSDDSSDTISSVADSNGYAQLQLASSSVTYEAGDWVKISGTSNYDGIHRILAVSGDDLTIDTSYIAGDSGTVQFYYQNYTSLIRVYADATLIGTIEQRPNSDNSTYVDVRKYILSKLSTNNDINQASFPNDSNLWTSFYIEFAERYDDVIGGVIVNTISAYTSDSGNACFASHSALQFGNARGGNMADYVIGVITANWMTFFEKPTLFEGKYFDLSIINAGGESIQILEFDINNNEIATQNFTVTNNGDGLYRVRLDQLSFNSLTKSISVSAIDSPDTLASYGSPVEFDTSLDNNNSTIAIDSTHVINFWHGGASASGFVQVFSVDGSYNVSAIGSPLGFGAILGDSNFSAQVDSNHFINFWFESGNGLFAQVFEVNLSTYAVTANGSPLLIDANAVSLRGSCDMIDSVTCIAFWSSTDNHGFCQGFEVNLSTYAITPGPTATEFVNDATTGGYSVKAFDSTRVVCFWSEPGIAKGQFFSYDSGSEGVQRIGSETNIDSYGGMNIRENHCEQFSSSTYAIFVGDFAGTCEILAGPTLGSPESTLTIPTVESIIKLSSSSAILTYMTGGNGYIREYSFLSGAISYTGNELVFDTNNTNEIAGVLFNSENFILFWQGASGDGFTQAFRLSSPVLSSDTISIDINTKCSNQSIYLSWLNSLGGWEYWDFTARKTHGYDIGNVQTIKRDILQNWDTDFISGETEREHISVEANKRTIVRSQNLTTQQVEAIARIKASIKVVDFSDPDNPITVIVDKSSFDYTTDKDKMNFIQFTIEHPGEIIQSQ